MVKWEGTAWYAFGVGETVRHRYYKTFLTILARTTLDGETCYLCDDRQEYWQFELRSVFYGSDHQETM